MWVCDRVLLKEKGPRIVGVRQETKSEYFQNTTFPAQTYNSLQALTFQPILLTSFLPLFLTQWSQFYFPPHFDP